MHFLRLLTLLGLGVITVSPASARRRRAPKPPKPAPVQRVAPAPAPVPAPEVAQNVVLFLADGYAEAGWRSARADGYLAMDRMPVVGSALPPDGLAAYDPTSLGRTLGAGQGPSDIGPLVPLLGLARQYGRSVALVGGESAADPVLCGLMLGGADGDAWRRLTEARVDVLFGRSIPEDATPVLTRAGYHVADGVDAVLQQEAVPAAGAAPAANVPFETMVFRALHLAAKSPKGFLMAVSATAPHVPAEALDAALASMLRYAERDRRTLVLVLVRRGDADLTIHAAGPTAAKFGGVLAATDIPKIVAGVAGMKVFRRDFSPLFTARSARPEAPPRTASQPARGRIQALPW